MNTQLNDLFVCKEWLTDLGLMNKPLNPQKELKRCSICGNNTLVFLDIRYGRYQGDICQSCYDREDSFLNKLRSLDETRWKELVKDETDNITIAIKKATVIVKPSKKRAELEKSGQQSLFDL